VSFLNNMNLSVCKTLENNYHHILDEYLNFNFKSNVNLLNFFSFDQNYQIWKGIYEISKNRAKIDETWIKLNPYKKCHSWYGVKLNDKKIWETLIILNNSQVTKLGEKFFPKTSSILNQHKEITSISVAKFPSHSYIPPHRGDKNIIRIHLGLIVPDGDIMFCVKGECKKWSNGKSLAFNDFYEHQAWNNTEEDRINLIVDVNRKFILNESK